MDIFDAEGRGVIDKELFFEILLQKSEEFTCSKSSLNKSYKSDKLNEDCTNYEYMNGSNDYFQNDLKKKKVNGNDGGCSWLGYHTEVLIRFVDGEAAFTPKRFFQIFRDLWHLRYKYRSIL